MRASGVPQDQPPSAIVYAEGRAGEALHQGHDVFGAAGGAGQSVEGLEAGEREENIDRLVERLGDWPAVPLGEPPEDDPQPLAPALVTRSHSLLEVRVERGQAAETAHSKPVGGPEVAEGRDEPSQGLERVRSPKGDDQALADLAAGREIIEEVSGGKTPAALRHWRLDKRRWRQMAGESPRPVEKRERGS